MSRVYQYTNSDGLNPATVCGQAACATLLTYCGFQMPSIETLRRIERSHPPDLMGGAWGTSPTRIAQILVTYGARSLRVVDTVNSLKTWVTARCPVVCIIQNTSGLFGLGDGAHWFVVYAQNSAGVYVTNYGSSRHLTWSDFESKWSTVVPGLAQSLGFKGVTSTSRIAPDPVPLPPNLA